MVGLHKLPFLTGCPNRAAACVDVDTFDPLARLIEGWRATAEIHANPELVKLSISPRSEPAVEVKRPKAS